MHSKVMDIRAFIGSKDLNLSTQFYLALGWNLEFDSDSLRVLELAGHRFYLQAYYQQAWCENTMLHVSVENVDCHFKEIKHRFASQDALKQGRMSPEVKDEGYARVFYVWDPAGVLIHFAQFPNK